MQYKLISLLFFSTLFVPGSNQMTTYSTLEEGSGKISFRIKNAGFWVDGSLADLKVEGVFDPDKPSNSNLGATVSVATMETGIRKRDEHLMREDYFDQANHPNISLASTSIQKKGEQFIFKGSLTIKGTTKSIEFPFTVQPKGNGMALKGSFSLDRIDYGVGSKSWILGRRVEIELSCTLLP